jgi:tRNA threonylcarbamoyladenosine biosynthesis protein TsaB
VNVPLILAFDTATPHLAVVLAQGSVTLACRVDDTPALSHAEKLNVFIDEVMREAGAAWNALDAVAVGIGPGSYTGSRIGLSAAKGLCFALGKPLIGMGTLEVLVAEWQAGPSEADPGDMLWPMVDARRMEVYTRPFTATAEPAGPTAPLILDEAWCAARNGPGQAVVFGDGADKAVDLWRRWPQIRHVSGIRPSVRGLARCAAGHFAQGRFGDLAYLVPEYGKAANVAQRRGG